MRSFINPIIKCLLIFCAGAAVICAGAGCGRKPDRAAAKPLPIKSEVAKPAKVQIAKDDGPKLELSQKGVILNWVEKGQLRMKASGSQSKYDDVAKVASMLKFSAQLFDDGKLTASLVAPEAVADTTSRIVTATGGVTLKSMQRNTTVTAPRMRWYAKEQKVVGDGGVKITSSMGTLEGAAFLADTSMKTITIKDSSKGLKF